MLKFTIHELACFDAVAQEGGFQAAAEKLRRTHPTVFAAVGKLERQLGIKLLDRSGYRVALTHEGKSFHRRARTLLRDASALGTHAEQLAMGAEPELRIVLGDLCPLSQTLELLSDFFDQHSSTRPQLHFEAISGPWERLFDGDADLIVHHIDKTNPKLDFIPLCTIRVIPVVAPGYLPFPVSRTITPEQLRPFVQCVIRDTASHSAARDYFLIDESPKWTVADQLMKKELILRGRVWGHLPTFLVDDEVRAKRLLNIRGRHLPGTTGDLVAARRRDVPHGPVAEKLWRYIGERAGRFSANTNAELRRKRR